MQINEEQLKELEDFLLRWCYENGTPFTTINYSVNSGLEVFEDEKERQYYHAMIGTYDEFIYGEDNEIIGIATKRK